MEIKDLDIECVRCTSTEKLVVPALVKQPNGEFQPVNTQRPLGWIAGPADLNDVKKGLCPDCTNAWQKAQEQFLTKQLSDETPKELRVPTSMPVKSVEPITSTIRPVKISEINHHGVAHVQRPDSIPQRATVVEKPAITANARPVLTQQMAKNPHGVSVAPTLRTIKAETPSLNTTMMGRTANNGAVVTSGVTHHSVPVAASAVVKEAAPVLMNRIGDGLPATVGAGGVSAPAALPPGAGMVNSTAPVPIVGGGMVQTSAPVPLPPVQPSNAGVTISAPKPIEMNGLKIDMSDVPA